MSKRDPVVPEMGERLWLAAVGKHPGWNDHLDDIGLDMDRLVAVKRHLYVDGIGGVIGAGTWESMDESSRDEGFAHSFLWRQPDGLVVGRMWSSSDGKGRRKYPMIVCALCRSLPLAFAAGPVLDRLRRLEEQCKSVSSAAEVISAVDRMRGELRDLASYTPPVTGEPYAGEAAAAKLADAEEMGPDGRGLLRVLYQMEREMAAYLRPEGAVTGSRSRTLEVRAQHMRLPSVFEPESVCWSVWSRLLLGRVDQLAPLLLINKDGKPWVDVIVGEPGVTQLVCLQGSVESSPLTTDIPFTIDEEIERAGLDLIEQARAGDIRETDPGFIDVPSDRLAPFMKMARRAPGGGESNRKQLVIASIAAAVVLLIVVVLAIVFLGGGESGTGESETEPGRASAGSVESRASGSDQSSAGRPGREDASPAADPMDDRAEAVAARDDERLDRFRFWCEQAEGWYLPFVAALDTDAAADDRHLSEAVLGSLRRASAAGVECDPLEVSPGRYRSISALAENPPAEMIAASAGSVVEGALRQIKSVRDAIGPDAWPASGSLVAVIDTMKNLGVQPPLELDAIRSGLASERGGEAALGVAGLLTHRADVVRLGDAMRVRAGSASGLREAGAGEQAGWFEALDVTGDPGGDLGGDLGAWLAASADRCEEVASLGALLVDAASRDLPRIDGELLKSAMSDVTGASPESDLRIWLAVLSDRSLYLLDAATDPRRVFAGDGGLGGVGVRLDALLGDRDDGRAAGLADEVRVWLDDMDSLGGLTWNEANKSEIEGRARGLVDRRIDLLDRLDALERGRRFEAETYLAGLRGRGSVSTTGSGAVDGVWVSARDSLIEAFERDHDLVGLSREIDSLSAALGAIEASMPPVGVDLSGFGAAGARVGVLLADSRETRLGEAAARYTQPGVVDRAAEIYADWSEKASDASGLARVLIDACDTWTRLDEPVETGTFADSIAGWGDTWIGERVSLGEVDPRLGLLAESVSPGRRGDLSGLIADASAPVEVVHAAWSELDGASPAWPADRDELSIDAGAVARLRAALGGLAPERRGPIEESLNAGASARWSRVASSAAGWPAFRSLVPLAGTMGLTGSALPAEFAFDVMAAGLMDEIEGGGALDGDRMLARVEGLLESGAGLGGQAEATRWLSAMRDTLAGRESGDVDYRTIGPARAGWEVEPFESGRRLVYTRLRDNTPAVRMAFRLVETPETGAFYLSETEAPTSMLLEFGLVGANAELVLGAMDPDWDPLGDPRPGPRVWTWRRQRGGGGRSIQLSRTWTARPQGAESEYYEAGLRELIGRPGGDMPLQRVSPEAAALLAALAGCRLPTAREWSAAHASVGAPSPSDEWNLRDQSFETQRAHAASMSASRWPDEGAFTPALGGSFGSDAESHEWSDGRLWFEAVGSGRDRPFRHLIGNVAEYVLSGTDVASLLTDRHGEPGAFAAGVVGGADRPGAFSVIGGSALSPPGISVSVAHPLDGTSFSSGFSDVGFRLAFSPGAEPPLVVQIGELVRSAPFLRPAR